MVAVGEFSVPIQAVESVVGFIAWREAEHSGAEVPERAALGFVSEPLQTPCLLPT